MSQTNRSSPRATGTLPALTTPTRYQVSVVRLALTPAFLSGLDLVVSTGPVQLTHIIMAVALALLALSGIRVHVGGFFGLAYALLGVSTMSILLTGGTYGLVPERLFDSMFRILLAVMLVATYYLAYVAMGRSIRALFAQYLTVAVFFSIVAILQQVVFLTTRVNVFSFFPTGAKEYGTFLGVSGFSVEPSYLAFALLPAAAFYVVEFVSSLRVSIRGLVVLAAVLMSTSSNGYLGLVLAAIIAALAALWEYVSARPARIGLLALAAVAVVPIVYWMSQLEFVQVRLQDTLELLELGATRATGANLSSYALAVNTEIATRSLQDNGLFGVGFGQYSVAFDYYIPGYEIPSYRGTLPGRGSATSFLLRLGAELGVFGVAAVLLVVVGFMAAIVANTHRAIAISCLAAFVIISLRMGAYFDNGVLFVVLMSFLLWRESLRRSRESRGAGSSPALRSLADHS